jgi:N-acetylmuramoyl-L-alanine amidase
MPVRPGPPLPRALRARFALSSLLVVLIVAWPDPAVAQPYTVVKGDTISGLAKRFSTTVTELKRRNPTLANPNRIRIGAVIEVPEPPAAPTTTSPAPVLTGPATVDAPTTGAPVAPTTTVGPSTTTGPAAAVFPPPLPSNTTYTVVKGDRLTQIAKRFAVTVEALASANGLSNLDLIGVGKVLQIPGVTYPDLPKRLRERSERLVLMGYFDASAAEFGLDPALLKALGFVESGWQPGVVSSVGAIGVCQLMPATAAELATKLGDPTLDPWDPVDNIRMSAKFLRDLTDRFKGDTTKAVAAYYQGHAAVKTRGLSVKGSAYAQAVLAHQPLFVPVGPTSQPG